MKIDRLLGILVILLQKEKVTAPDLAGRFEVSRRTIQRDIEHLCKAGIPLVTTQGQNGGISIMEGYKIDKTLLTTAEMQAIMAGLQSLDSVSKTNFYSQLMEKLLPGSENIITGDQHILIDLSSWYKTSLSPKIELIHRAIQDRNKIAFHYFSPQRESVRQIEPYYLLFQWSSWYVWGYCLTRQDFRMFKLNRMTELTNTEEPYNGRTVQMPDVSMGELYSYEYPVKGLFTPECKWRLIEECGLDNFEELKDGCLLCSVEFTDKKSAFQWVLSFEDKAEVLEPKELQEELKNFAQKLLEKYKES